MFLTLSTNLYGNYIIILADNAGPIEKVDCVEFSDRDEAAAYCEELAKAYNIRYYVN